jgi:uncharacterized membrane protein
MDGSRDLPATSAIFEALIVPHRSLSTRGLCTLVLAVAGLSALIGIRFWMLGAWPVLAFGAPEVAVLIFLLRLNARRARASELLILDDARLTIIRVSASGRREECHLPSSWLQVGLEETPGRVPRLLLSHRDRLLEIGQMLGELEKRDLALSLRNTLHKIRNPQFDNAQLRDSLG